MGVHLPSATPDYCDNKSAIQIAHIDVFQERNKQLRLIVTLSVIISFRAVYNFILLRLMINLWISSL